MLSNFDVIVYIIAHETLFHPCKIGWTLHGAWLISYNAGQASADVIISTPVCSRRICDQARENSKKSSSAREIIKFAGYAQIDKIVRCQFYL